MGDKDSSSISPTSESRNVHDPNTTYDPLKAIIKPHSQLISIQLDESNYLLWKFQIETAIRGYGLEDHILGTLATPSRLTSMPPQLEAIMPEKNEEAQGHDCSSSQHTVSSSEPGQELTETSKNLSHTPLHDTDNQPHPEEVSDECQSSSALQEVPMNIRNQSPAPATSVYQKADVLTKPLSRQNFTRFRHELNVDEAELSQRSLTSIYTPDGQPQQQRKPKVLNNTEKTRSTLDDDKAEASQKSPNSKHSQDGQPQQITQPRVHSKAIETRLKRRSRGISEEATIQRN